jgi:hemolysin III
VTESALIDDPRAAALSPSARRLLRRPRPRYRGVLHRWAAIAAVPVGIALVAGGDGARARLALAAFAVGTGLMFAVSALVHHRDWGIDRVELMVRLDHSAIFVKFATTVTPLGMLGLDPPASGWLLAIVWTGSILGILAEWVPVHPPRGVMNGLYLALGWSMLIFTPWLFRALTTAELVWLFAGGLAYTVGAVIVGARRPDPWPDTFGYHEVWHVFVVVAVVCHTVMAASLGW